jgi:hypothetical protein
MGASAVLALLLLGLATSIASGASSASPAAASTTVSSFLLQISYFFGEF